MLSDWKALGPTMRQLWASPCSGFPRRGNILWLKDFQLTDFKFCLGGIWKDHCNSDEVYGHQQEDANGQSETCYYLGSRR